MVYFAYGSNMFTARLRKRAPSARPLGVARLAGYALRFHKAGRDGSAKCDASYTGDPDDAVLGVLFELEPCDGSALDRAEGLGQGYSKAVLPVETQAGPREAFLYLAQPEHCVSGVLPFDWYRACVIRGAREHGLPAAYIHRLEHAPAQRDPDPRRSACARRLLHLGSGA